MSSSSRLVGFGLLVATAFLALSTLTQPSTAATLRQFSPETQAKLDLIRKLSLEAGLPQIKTSQDLCFDPGCLDAALDILSAMNASVDPCQDFFQYSCGRWLANNPVPPSASRWSRFNALRDEVNNITQDILHEPEDSNDALPINQVKQFFNTCLNTSELERVGLDPLKQAINEVGGWQLLNPQAWNSTAFNWLKAVAETRRRTLQSAVLHLYVSADIKNTPVQIIYLDQPGFGLPRNMLVTPENYTGPISAYETFIFEVAQELGSTQTEAQLRAMAKSIISLEGKLATISTPDDQRDDFDRMYNRKVLSQYQTETDEMDDSREFTFSWKEYIDTIFTSAQIPIPDTEPLVVSETEYIRSLIPILKEAVDEQVTLANYIIWRFTSGLVGDTTQNMRDIVFKFQQALTGATEQAKREVTCANAANSVFGMAIGVKYIEKAFEESSKIEMNEMVDNLRIAFVEMVDDAEWMEQVTKDKAKEKEQTIVSNMAYPDWLNNKEDVERFYEGLTLGDGHFTSQLALALYRMDKGLKGLRQATDKGEWPMYPGVVNAAYWPEYNSITFPAGILQPPFFGGNRPKHQNYGGIGVVIGHEITHGFDNQGAQFDKDGNANNWWDDATLERFNARGQCMDDQYSGFYAEAADMYVNGRLTLGENIADNGGLRESYLAYKKATEDAPELRLPGLEALSTDQLFFLGYANIWCESITPEGLVNQILTDPHSPAEFRVKGPTRNYDEFAKAYECKEGDYMNPPDEDRCIVW